MQADERAARVNSYRRPQRLRLLREDRIVSVPEGGWDALRQALFMLACYAGYAFSRMLVVGRAAVARANGHAVMDLEKDLAIYVEPWIQSRISAIRPLMHVFVYSYQDVHLPIIIATLTFAFTRRRNSWPLVRNWFLIMNFVAVTIFALLPTMPPRMLSSSGVVDIDFLYGVRSRIMGDGFLANPFAAMPSLHFGYALFVAAVIFMFARQRWLRWLALAYPVMILTAVIATGNHFILDCVAGALLTVATYMFAVNLQSLKATDRTVVAVRERDG